MTTGVAVFGLGLLGLEAVAVEVVPAGSVGSFAASSALGDFAHPMATLNVSAIPTTTAMKKRGASAKNRRKRAT